MSESETLSTAAARALGGRSPLQTLIATWRECARLATVVVESDPNVGRLSGADVTAELCSQHADDLEAVIGKLQEKENHDDEVARVDRDTLSEQPLTAERNEPIVHDAKRPEPHQDDVGNWVCQHGTAMDVHCCNCHLGFVFDMEHECPDSMADAAEMLWVVLANVSGGDWTKQTPEWQEAAGRWRDNYFAALQSAAAGGIVPPRSENQGK